MSVDKVKKYFAGYGMESRVLEFDVSSATVELGGRRLPICHKSRRGYLPGCFPEKI